MTIKTTKEIISEINEKADRQIEQAEKKIERAKKRVARETLKAERAADKEMSEEDYVKRYAARVIANEGYHGRIDGKKFSNLANKKTVNRALWMDTDFYFSIVFQSSTQKDKFLKEFTEKMGLNVEGVKEGGIQILNGMALAGVLGIDLEPETSKDYPLPDLDVREFVLDSAEM